MNIGIDIDGVFTDLEKFMRTEGEIFYGKKIANQNGSDLDSLFGVSKERKKDFWDAKYRDYILNYPFRPDANLVTHELKDDGHKLTIITVRKWHPEYGFKTPEDMTAATKKSLKRENIYYDDYLEAAPPKTDAALEHNIDVFIEDSGDNALALSKVTKVIIMDAAYNRHINGKNIYRAHDWDQIYDIISNLRQTSSK